ncbi:MAG: DUF3604 domain-containing protein [Gammaproteobacteria bacterium]|nr:DUF3604 domain-containing protein [Gammaproteobacteria bacterium]
MNQSKTIACGIVVLSLVHSWALASPPKVSGDDFAEQRVYSPYAGRNYPDEVLFGDMHFHTELSFDAGLIGTRLDVDAGYRMARGEKVISNTGQPVQLVRGLDYLVITDHAEFMGLANMIRDSDSQLLSLPWGQWIHERFNAGPEGRLEAFQDVAARGMTGDNPFSSDDAARSIWRNFVEKAETYNEPGSFTAMTGFEWSSTPAGNNLHRVVVIRDGVEKSSEIVPWSMFNSVDPEGLWDYLATYENKVGGQALAIPHNGNLSNGLMFSDKRFGGKRMTREYAEKRARWEPVIEASQIKGDGEAHPRLSPDDEFADFEKWDVSNLLGTTPKEEWMLKYEYGRSALKTGLQLKRKVGANPYKFGMTGSTDTHTALATTREENYFGKYRATEPSANRHNKPVIPTDDPDLQVLTSQESASGLTGVWARHNTRGEIFDAIKRKEVYATTGTRIRVRVFGGWNYEEGDVSRHDFADRGYQGGVPMGGELFTAPGGKAPRFMLRALRDPDGANLDRLQVIKGWIDRKGNTHERIYDVAVSGERKIASDGRARESVGSTVDIENASYTNTIGAPLLSGFWEDPDFDPGQSAFYYVRVLEIPTPRWTTYDAAFYGIERPDNVPATVQDRAYTSPIWYTPDS